MLRTRKALDQTGTLAVLGSTGAEIAFFDEGNFADVEVGGEFLKRVHLSEQAVGFDKLVYSCCMKTHFRADFSMSLKLPFGFTKKSDRIGFHLGHLGEVGRFEFSCSAESDSYGWTHLFYCWWTFQRRRTKSKSCFGFRRSGGFGC